MTTSTMTATVTSRMTSTLTAAAAARKSTTTFSVLPARSTGVRPLRLRTADFLYLGAFVVTMVAIIAGFALAV